MISRCRAALHTAEIFVGGALTARKQRGTVTNIGSWIPNCIGFPFAVTNSSASPAAPFHESDAPSLRRDSGFIDGLPAKLGKMSISALLTLLRRLDTLRVTPRPQRLMRAGF
jgi:hypothetical protein